MLKVFKSKSTAFLSNDPESSYLLSLLIFKLEIDLELPCINFIVIPVLKSLNRLVESSRLDNWYFPHGLSNVEVVSPDFLIVDTNWPDCKFQCLTVMSIDAVVRPYDAV